MPKINQLRLAHSFLIEKIDVNPIGINLKIASIVSYIENLFGGNAPIGLIVEKIKSKYKDSKQKLEELSETEIDYEGPFLTIKDLDYFKGLTPSDFLAIEFLVKE